MKVVIQRVSEASVNIDNQLYSSINNGLLILLGIHSDDDKAKAEWMMQKVLNLRIFPDETHQMNYSLQDVGGAILLVSQFTLYGNALKGNRPSFTTAAHPDIALPLYEYCIELLETYLAKKIGTGVFGANMQIQSINDGPVTIIIEK